MNRYLLAAGIVIGGLAAWATAGPLNKSRVPADATWVVHVDLEAGLASSLGAWLKNNDDPEYRQGLAKFTQETGLDPLKDVLGVTVYGAAADGSDGVALIEASAAVDQIIEHARRKGKTFEEITEGRLTLYTWKEHGSARYATIRPGAEDNERFVVVAADKARVLAGVELLGGKADSLANTTEGLLARSPAPGSIIFAAGVNLTGAKAMPFQEADGFVVDIGQHEEEVFAELVVAPKGDSATELMQLMQGAVATGVMFTKNEPGMGEVVKLLRSVNFAAEDGLMTARLRCRKDHLIGALSQVKTYLEGRSENAGARVTPAANNEDHGEGGKQ